MSLENRLSKQAFIGNGSTVAFPFSFKVWKQDQVKVYIGVGNEDEDVTEACTIVINADSGGVVTFDDAPAEGVDIVVCREMPFVQEDVYVSGTRFDPHEIEDRLDQDCAERQELLEKVSRAVLAPITSGESGNTVYADELLGAKEYVRSAREDVVAMVSHVDDVSSYVESVAEMVEPLAVMQDELSVLSGVASSIPVVAENVHDVSVVADSLQGFPIMTMDLGLVTEPNEEINVPQFGG